MNKMQRRIKAVVPAGPAEVIVVTLKTTRPPNLSEWTQFKCRNPSPLGHTYTHKHSHTDTYTFCTVSSHHFHVLTWVVGQLFMG